MKYKIPVTYLIVVPLDYGQMKYEHIPLSPEFEKSISEGQESNHVISMSDNKSN